MAISCGGEQVSQGSSVPEALAVAMQRALEYAALFPHNCAFRAWLVALLENDPDIQKCADDATIHLAISIIDRLGWHRPVAGDSAWTPLRLGVGMRGDIRNALRSQHNLVHQLTTRMAS